MTIPGTPITIENGKPSKMIFVIAMDYNRFIEWCRSYEINPRSSNVKFVHSSSIFLGHVNAWVKDLGTPYSKAHDIYDTLEHYKAARGFKMIP